jgi:hypothetical protein
MQGGNIQQQAVGQEATMQAQQQLAAQQALQTQQAQMAGLSTNQVGQQAAALGGYNQAAQGAQQNILGSINAANQARVGMQSNQNSQNAQIASQNAKFQSGLLNGAGAMIFAQGGSVENLKEGGKVPGEAKVAGDSLKNDTVPALLSPKEIVIPRSITMHPDAPMLAMQFVKDELEKHRSSQNSYAQGGMAQDEASNEQPRYDYSQTTPGPESPRYEWQQNMATPNPAPEGVSGGEMSMAPQAAPVMPSAAPTDELAGHLEEQAKGVEQESAAASAGAKAKAFLAGQAAKDLQKEQIKGQAQLQDLDQQRKQFEQDVVDQKIDPNRYLHNMGTGQKILTAIGLMLSGAGAAGAGQQNMAQAFLQNQIDNDIKGQQAELGKKENLLTRNMQQYGNLKDSLTMTKANMMDIAALKMEQEASKSTDKIVQARGLQQAAALRAQADQIVGPLKMKQALIQQAVNGQVEPEKLVPSLVPKEHQTKVFEELKQAQAATRGEKDIMQAFDTANKENTLTGRVGRLGFKPPSIKALDAHIMPLIHSEVGRVTEQEQEALQHLYPSPGDKPETVAMKRKAFQEFINSKKLAPTANAYGIDIKNFQSTGARSPEQQKWLAWANQNPQDPRSIALKKKLGVE